MKKVTVKTSLPPEILQEVIEKLEGEIPQHVPEALRSPRYTSGQAAGALMQLKSIASIDGRHHADKQSIYYDSLRESAIELAVNSLLNLIPFSKH